MHQVSQTADPRHDQIAHRFLRGCGMRAVNPDQVSIEIFGRDWTELTPAELERLGTLLISGKPIPSAPADPARAAMLAEERAARMRRSLEAIQADAVTIITHIQTAGIVHEAARRIVRTAGEALEVAS